MNESTRIENAREKIGQFLTLSENRGRAHSCELWIPYTLYTEAGVFGETFMGHSYKAYHGDTLKLVPKTAIIEFDNYPLPLENAGGE